MDLLRDDLALGAWALHAEALSTATARPPHFGPVHRLMSAMLLDALRIAQGAGANIATAERRRARQWFASRSRATLFDFEHVCDVLEISPVAVRAQLPLEQRGRPGRMRPSQSRRGVHCRHCQERLYTEPLDSPAHLLLARTHLSEAHAIFLPPSGPWRMPLDEHLHINGWTATRI